MPDLATTKRRLSLPRVLFVIAIITVCVFVANFGVKEWKNELSASKDFQPWFASYVDVTATPYYAFEQTKSNNSKNAILSFVVSNPSKPCEPTWGGVYNIDKANNALDLERRIARLKQQGGSVGVSFGGLNNDELAVKCKDKNKLAEAYRSIIDAYDINTVDFDLELGGLTDLEAASRRAEVVAMIQSEKRSKGESLAVWLTLPVIPSGLTEDGTNAVTKFLEKDVDLSGVNVMTMNYGQSLEKGSSMLDGSKNSLQETHRQLKILYQQQGISLTDAVLWSKIGATPMIGQNDVQGEIFTPEDAEGLNAYMKERGGARISMWSANRDTACGENYVDTKRVSDSCSGVSQEKGDYASVLGEGFEGNLYSSANVVTVNDPNANISDQTDDPSTSPYQIWTESGTYLQGTKVVWHRNVYESKWWTQGDIPDNPVLQSHETPWRLVGPVLPGEKPVMQATLPAGTYPMWSGEAVYEAGSRVLFDSVPYQAKWWTKGDSPAASTANQDSSPWVPLTQNEVNKIVAEKNINR